MALPLVVLNGTLTADPELRFTPSGKPVVTLRVACNERRKQDDGTWANTATTYLDVQAWHLAEEIAEGLRKGDRVTVTGRLQQEAYETFEGNKKVTMLVAADEVSKTFRPQYVHGAGKPANESGSNYDNEAPF